MKLELQRKLFEKYPKIFKQKDSHPNESSMCFGIDCGDGWYTLIDILCNALQSHINLSSIPQVEATCVKQKFGGLRFYTNSTDEVANNIIYLIETLSYHVCESCGSTDHVELNAHGWITALCEQCKNRKE